MEYSPLFQPGFTDISIDQFQETFVEPFEPADRRRYLSERFTALIERFQETSLSAEIWIDGSFSTDKPEPGDIDVIFFIDGIAANALSIESKNILTELNDRKLSQIRYQSDVFIVANQDANDRSYWRGWFGFSREEVPKGIVRLYI